MVIGHQANNPRRLWVQAREQWVMYSKLKAYTNINLGSLMSIESTLSDGVTSRNHTRHWAFALKRSRLLPSAGLSSSLPTA